MRHRFAKLGLAVVSGIIVGFILAVLVESPAARTPRTVPPAKLAKADRLMQQTAGELQRCWEDTDDFETHCANMEHLVAQLKSLGWCVEGGDHLSLNWRRCADFAAQ